MATEDPGEPAADDREVVKLQSGPSKGRLLRRKPRLQLRLPIGYDPARLRRALALALQISEGETSFSIESVQDRKQRSDDQAIRVRLEEDVEQLQRIIGDLAFKPLRDGYPLGVRLCMFWASRRRPCRTRKSFVDAIVGWRWCSIRIPRLAIINA